MTTISNAAYEFTPTEAKKYWAYLYTNWQEALKQNNIDPTDLFTPLTLYVGDTDRTIDEDHLYWLPNSKEVIAKDFENHKDFLTRLPNCHGFDQQPRSMTTCLLALWEAKGDIEKTCAILVAASCFMRTGSRNYDSYFPYKKLRIRGLESVAVAKITRSPFSIYHTRVLPYEDPFCYPPTFEDAYPKTLLNLIDAIIGEHVHILKNYAFIKYSVLAVK